MYITDEGADRLIGAVAEQAVKEYKRAYRVKQKNPGSISAEESMISVERFFKGTWFKRLFPHLNGPELFAALQAQCAKGKTKNESYSDVCRKRRNP